jgi:hypothetical protein
MGFQHRTAENGRRGGNLGFAGRFFLYGHVLKKILIRQERGNLTKDAKYATQIFSFFRAAKPAPSAVRPAAAGFMKFHRHAGRLQQVAHQPAENSPCSRIMPMTNQATPDARRKTCRKISGNSRCNQPLIQQRLGCNANSCKLSCSMF